MGLTAESMGIHSVDQGLLIDKKPGEFVIALAGNPNVGKSTVFNALTGMKQHTGNWPGKTVATAQGRCKCNDKSCILVDLPGTYSLMAHSAEEEVARNFICFGEPDAVIVVCDASCLERNLNLVLQTIEITPRVVLCVNLIDEAKKKHIEIDTAQLSEELGIPVVATTARNGTGLTELMECAIQTAQNTAAPKTIRYIRPIEDAMKQVIPSLEKLGEKTKKTLNLRWTALRLLEEEETLHGLIDSYFETSLTEETKGAVLAARTLLQEQGISMDKLQDKVVSCLVITAEGICAKSVTIKKPELLERDRKIDRILTSKATGIPIMLFLLAGIFWLTIVGANYPSEFLSKWLFRFGDLLESGLIFINAPTWLIDVLIMGVYRVLAWVVSVMLPPMAIFFPLFTLLEDLGYLPRIAFNLDKHFKKAGACGKQALTMCLVFFRNRFGKAVSNRDFLNRAFFIFDRLSNGNRFYKGL